MISFFMYFIFSIIVLIDVYVDMREGVLMTHVWHELVIVILSGIIAGWHLKLLIGKENKIKEIQRELLETKDSYREWKIKSHNSALALRNMIDQQFDEWVLSPSEKDVALLLIKGLSMKEIAEIRQSQEKTVRQHATTIYKKANISGRQELAAFFLEDLLSDS